MPEAAYDRRFPTQRVVLLDWTAPVTNKILIEASGIHRVERWGNMHLQERGLDLDPRMIGVLDTAATVPGLGVIANLAYRGRAVTNYNNSFNQNFHWRFNVSYITGSHALKIGTNDAIGRHSNSLYLQNNLQYRFTNGIPNQITIRALPTFQKINVDHDYGLFAQDKWTIGKFTASGGIRYDHYINSFPEQELGPTPYTPGRNLTFGKTKNANLSDITPRLQLAYDLFGNGKTALKTSLNKYLQGLGTTGLITGNPNPINLVADSVSRAWEDTNRNYVPDCVITNAVLQDNRATGGDLCGAMNDSSFGKPLLSTRFDPEPSDRVGQPCLQTGKCLRPAVQQQLLAAGLRRTPATFRRWYSNFPGQRQSARRCPATSTEFSVPGAVRTRGCRAARQRYNVRGFQGARQEPQEVGQSSTSRRCARKYGKMNRALETASTSASMSRTRSR
jgi:hypothetical protein